MNYLVTVLLEFLSLLLFFFWKNPSFLCPHYLVIIPFMTSKQHHYISFYYLAECNINKFWVTGKKIKNVLGEGNGVIYQMEGQDEQPGMKG